MTLKTMLQRTYPNLSSVDFNDIVALHEYKDGIKLVCSNSYKRCCYPVLVDFIVDYEEQVFITGIKANMPCYIGHVPIKKRELVNRL